MSTASTSPDAHASASVPKGRAPSRSAILRARSGATSTVATTSTASRTLG
jgi:hypothetical protein